MAEHPPFSRLAAEWTPAGAPAGDLVERTREALATVQPSDLAEVAGLVETLTARAGQEASRAGARRALFALLDAARRRFFTEALRPAEVEPWTRLLVPALDRADYTLGEMLRAREETGPRTVALRVLGEDACELTVSDLGRCTRSIARGLHALLGDGEPRVALLGENSLDGALADLACLTNGI
ncbi:MAG TPA: AMP-dependent synthetase, partial [Anaeromyxobacteraceae bacterium]